VIRVESSWSEDLHLLSMTGSEALSRPFEFTLQLSTTARTLDLTSALGATMTAFVPGKEGLPRPFHGHVVTITEAGSRDGHQLYTAQLCPWFYLLSYNLNSRIFQDLNVVDIARTIFEERGFGDFKFALSQSAYRTYEYAVQYRESDFVFLSRLFEQEGIYYFFEHSADKHTLVLADSAESHEEYDLGEVEYLPVASGRNLVSKHLDSWQSARRMQAGAYVVDDYDFTRPRASLSMALAAPNAHAFADAEIFDYPGEYTKEEEGERLVRVRLHAMQNEFSRCWAAGNVPELGAGLTFKLANHPRAAENQPYLILGSSYEIDGSDLESTEGGDGGPHFHSRLAVMALSTPFRPTPSTKRPVISGHQTARVVGRAGDEITTDKYGRVKVQFPWDRLGESNEQSSCWVRVAQVWAGSGMGSMHVPRIGQEVLVSFLEGDPDRPIITGRVYNGAAMPPFELPAKAMVSGTKTESTPGGGGYNEISLDDTKGDEKIVVHGQRDMESTIEHDQRLTVHNNRTSTIDVDDLEVVGNNQTINVGANQVINIGGSSADTIAIAKALSIGAGYQVSVGAAMNETVAGLKAEEVGGLKSLIVGAASTEHVKGNKTVKTDKSLSEEASEMITIRAGKAMGLAAGEDLSIRGKKKALIEIAEELTIKVGSATITLKKNGDIAIKGAKISINGSGDVVLKGQTIAQN
jgi:type VI secretion system secreted protein VgrG